MVARGYGTAGRIGSAGAVRALGAAVLLTGVPLGCDPAPFRAPNATAASTVAANGTRATSPTATPPSPSPGPVPRCLVPLESEPKRPTPSGPYDKCPTSTGGPGPLPQSVVKLPDGRVVDVELALTPAASQFGLMFRTHLPEERGMLFVSPRPRMQRFWMKNTCLPLDMLFLDADGVVAGIEENVPVWNTNTYAVNCPTQYVLEVNAGWSRRHGIKPGDKFELPNVRVGQ